MSKSIVNVDKSNFENEVLKSNVPVMVDFWAAWCGPCRMVSPVIDQLADQYEGKVKVAKINVDENPELAGMYQVMSIPSILLFKEGRKIDELVGARPKQAFEDMIKKNV
ncbi:MAG: thioredoxin [Bacillota bacterium]